MTESILLIGAGGHAGVLADIMQQQNRQIAGIVCPQIPKARQSLAGLRHLENDADILDFPVDNILLVNGIGSLPGETLRHRIYSQFTQAGYRFATVIAESAIISPYATLGRGVQIMHGVIIQAGAIIGDNTIINTGAIIEHDCEVGANNHIAPGATLSGQVTTGEKVHIGTGASIIHCISIESHAIIGAGTCITSDVGASETVYPPIGKRKKG